MYWDVCWMQAGEFDEASLREAVMKVAAEDSATPAPSDDDS